MRGVVSRCHRGVSAFVCCMCVSACTGCGCACGGVYGESGVRGLVSEVRLRDLSVSSIAVEPLEARRARVSSTHIYTLSVCVSRTFCVSHTFGLLSGVG